MRFWNDPINGSYWSITLTEMLDEGCTDSDLEDFAERYDLSEQDVFLFAAMYHVKGTPCEGCVHCQHSSAMYPCIVCVRKHHEDYYVSFKEAGVDS